MMKPALLSAVIVITAATSLSASAAPVLFSGSSGNLAASASFDVVSGSQLQVTLSNISASDVMAPGDVLTGVFFNVIGNLALTPLSAITNGTTYLGTALAPKASAPGSDVGGEWAYKNGLSQYSANSGISSSGYNGLFGAQNTFPPQTNLSGPADPNGLQYGLTSSGDNLSTGNNAVKNNELTKFSVIFLLGNLTSGFQLSDISNVTFQYGTSLTEPSVVGVQEGGGRPNAVPEPATLGLVGVSLLALGAVRRRKQ